DPYAALHDSRRRCGGVELGSRIVRNGRPHSETASLVRIARMSELGVGGESSKRLSPIPEDAAVRPVPQIRRSDRATDDAALVAPLYEGVMHLCCRVRYPWSASLLPGSDL